LFLHVHVHVKMAAVA